METDQLIAVESSEDCALFDGEEGLECHHYRTKNPLCFGGHGSSEWPCKGQNIVLVNKAEYATWRLTR